MTMIEIRGTRQTGKSTLLAHYIKDAQEAGKKVLLTGPWYMMLKSLEKTHGFKADTVAPLRSEMKLKSKYDVIAIEEGAGNWEDYAKKFNKNFKKGTIVIATGGRHGRSML